MLLSESVHEDDVVPLRVNGKQVYTYYHMPLFTIDQKSHEERQLADIRRNIYVRKFKEEHGHLPGATEIPSEDLSYPSQPQYGA